MKLYFWVAVLHVVPAIGQIHSALSFLPVGWTQSSGLYQLRNFAVTCLNLLVWSQTANMKLEPAPSTLETILNCAKLQKRLYNCLLVIRNQVDEGQCHAGRKHFTCSALFFWGRCKNRTNGWVKTWLYKHNNCIIQKRNCSVLFQLNVRSQSA